MSLPCIFDLKRSSLDDGPGIRTVVFLKGCPLNCSWCHNPESIRTDVEIAYYPERCIECGECFQVCPAGVIDFASPERIQRERCQRCGKCAEVCYPRALQIVGKQYTVDELMEILLRDREFYEQSGGGVTFSGGEPMLHINYVGKVLERLKAEGVHTALETSGYFAYEEFAGKVLPFLDLVMYDLKLWDVNQHLEHTGQSNERIKSNFATLSSDGKVKVIPRVPLIPGITDSEENLQAIARFAGSCGHSQLTLLPYNPAGLVKRTRLGKTVSKL